jgi:hypothetical protein
MLGEHKNRVCSKFAHTTPHGAIKGKKQTQEIILYNLDVIISVGYRVKSQRGTQFRIWANSVLKEYLIKGYSINNKITSQRYEELKQLVQVLGRTVLSQAGLSAENTNDLINVVADYTYALDTLDKYDYQKLDIGKTTDNFKFHATYENAMATNVLPPHSFWGSWQTMASSIMRMAASG